MNTPKPGDFPIGSPESRAAARAVLESRDTGGQRLQIVTNVTRPRQDNSLPHVGQWQRLIDGGLMRFVYIPTGTDEETARRLLATP